MEWFWNRPFVQEYVNRYHTYVLKSSLTSPSARELGVVFLVLFGAGAATRLVRWLLLRRRLRRKRCQKNQHREEGIEKLRKKLTSVLGNEVDQELRAEIVNLSLKQLQERLKRGRLTPTQVLVAYQHKALEVHGRTNCLVEPLLEAEEWARELEATGNKDLPLYGVPVSIKDNYGIQGYDSTIGCAQWIGRPFPEDAVIVKVLKQQGAVPFVKTNIPQTMFSFETSNPIFGLTTNPHNSARGAGGSSGGEAALLGGGGSVLGFGSDIGGSIRIPAAFCGICGFKPSRGRLSSKGTHRSMQGQTLVEAATGPMARDVDGLVEAMRVLLVPLMFQLDTSIPPMPFNQQVYSCKTKLKIGYYVYDGFFHAVPACKRAVTEAVAALRAQGHVVVEWDFSRFGPRLVTCWAAAIMGDGSKTMANLLSVFNWWKMTTDVKDLYEEVTQDWQAQGLDAVICPGFSCPALPHYYPGYCQGAFSYTSVYNVLHYPAGSLPVTTVTKSDIESAVSYPTPDPWHVLVKKAQTGSEGLPVNVQVVTQPWQDELCLRVMKELETALKH